MRKPSTPSFVLELPIIVQPEHERIVVGSLEAGRRLLNATLGDTLTSLDLMRESRAWQAARQMPKGKERNLAFSACNEKVNFSEDAVKAIAPKHKNAAGFDDRLGAHETQKLATRVFKAAQEYALAKRGRPRFKGVFHPGYEEPGSHRILMNTVRKHFQKKILEISEKLNQHKNVFLFVKIKDYKVVIFFFISTVYLSQHVYAEEVDISWKVPPINSSGDIGYSTRYIQNSIGTKEYGQLFTTNYTATSYILNPSFANINATIGTISTVSDFSQDSNDQRNKGLSLVGGLNVDLFNSSKYPVGLSFSHTDSRTNNVFSTNDFTETRFGIRQIYYTDDNKTISTSFDRSSINDNDKNDVVTSFGGNYNFPLWGIANSINTKFTLSDRDETKEGSRVASFNSTHNISLDNGVNISAFSNFNNNSLRYLSENKLSKFDGQYFILGGTADWKPEFESREDDPLTISSSVSYVESKAAASTGESKSTQISASLSGIYVLTENLNIGVTGSLIKYVIDGKSKTAGLGGLVLNTSYTGVPFNIGGFTYNWNINGGLNQQGGTDSARIFSANTGVTHGLTRTFDLNNKNRITLSFSQNASKYKSYSLKETEFNSLSSNISGIYSFAVGEDFPGSLSATVSDVYTTGDIEQHYKNVNVMLTGHGQLTNKSSASINISYNWANQNQRVLGDIVYGPTMVNKNSNIIGTASYRHDKFLGIPQLNYVTSLTVDTLLTDNRLYGDVNGNYQKIRFGYENRLEYQIGLINLSLSAIYNDSGKDKNSMVYFSIKRKF